MCYLFDVVKAVSHIEIHRTIYSAFEKAARLYPEREALKGDGGGGKSFTYREIDSLTKNIAALLTSSSFAQAKEVGILSENRPEWGIAYLSILAAGKTVVPVDANLKRDEIAFILSDAGVRIVFTSGRFEEMLSALDLPLTLLSFEENSPHYWLRFPEEEYHSSLARNDEVAVLIYTSGTTGKPKAVELTHRNILANLVGITEALAFDPSDSFLSVLPLHHTFEATCGFLTPLASGASVVYARSLKSKEILEDIARNNITLMCGVPLLFEKMYLSLRRGIAAASFFRRTLFRILYFLSWGGWLLGFKWGKGLFRRLREKAGLGTIHTFVSGGAAIPPRIDRFFNLLGFDFLQGYGMTECSPVISTNRHDNIKFGSVGPPLPNLEVRIAHPDADGVGEILVRGESVTAGYRNNPAMTDEVLVDGWLHTGDLGKLQQGHLWIVGRKKNVIITAAGKNIYPEELEEKLHESPAILEAVVYGRKKSGKHGEEVCALIVPDLEYLAKAEDFPPNAELSRIRRRIDEAVKETNAQMAAYKKIVAFEVRLEELEKTSTKKVKRFLYT